MFRWAWKTQFSKKKTPDTQSNCGFKKKVVTVYVFFATWRSSEKYPSVVGAAVAVNYYYTYTATLLHSSVHSRPTHHSVPGVEGELL